LFRINFPNINNHSAAGPVFSWSCGGVFRQYRIILSADTASEVRQLLSQKHR